MAELLLAKATGPELRIGGWKAIHELNPRGTDEAAVNWVFVGRLQSMGLQRVRHD